MNTETKDSLLILAKSFGYSIGALVLVFLVVFGTMYFVK